MQQQQQPADQQALSFQTGFSLPALEVSKKHYSLDADMINGWQPKMKVVGPVPLNFDAPICDEVVQNLTSFGSRQPYRVVYLGPRYASSFKMHQEINKNYMYKYEAIINTNFPHLAAYFRKFYEHFRPKHPRPFKGMNPTLKNQQSVIFDASFQGANLDTAIKVNQNQYDIFMRVDSNTRGHMQWYNFTVKGGSQRKIKLNIVNFRRSKTLYTMSLKPYFRSSKKKDCWRQGGLKVKYEQKPLRYQFLTNIFSEQRLLFNCLSFQIQFEDAEETIQLAYCPPFTYSDNIQMIKSLQANISGQYGQSFLKQEVAGESLGGLQIPMLTITDPNVPDAYKRCILVTARIHPGETCGSYMVKGFLQYICSNEVGAIQLRKRIVFKVIPMVNPDGVVVGNFRTSLCGRDLNRMFKSQQSMLIPEVAAVKSLAMRLKSQFKGRLTFFLDFHGHSVRKNVFIYGPEYEIWQNNYYRTRILPKLIGERTQMFRYYSCSFRISQEKRTTARAVLLRHIPHCYTIEASIGFYYSPSQKKDNDFTPTSWQQMGKYVNESIGDYFQLIQQNVASKQKKPEKSQTKEYSLPKVKINQNRNKKKLNQTNLHLQQSPLEKPEQIEKDLFGSHNDQGKLSDKARQIIGQIQEEQKDKAFEDDYSEGGSDSQPADQDLDQRQLSSLHHHIILSLKEFKQRFYNRDDNAKSKVFQHSSAQIPVRKLEMIASLRKKAEQISSQKSQLTSQRLVSGIGLPQSWARGRSSRKSQYKQVQTQSFQIYVSKIQNKEIKQDCRISYFSPRKKYPNA